MQTRLLTVDPDSPDPAVIREAAAIIRQGGIVAFPTETVYGLGADALNEAAVQRIYAAKGRPARNPIIVHVATPADARTLASNWPAAAHALTERFWPGPLAVVVAKSPKVPDIVTAGRPSVALRCPANKVAQALIVASCRPIAAPSANPSERLSPTMAEHVRAAMDGRIDAILDGGSARVGLESTVVDLTVSPPRLLRPGAITLDELRDAVGLIELPAVSDVDSAGLASPGLMPRHYAPRTRLMCVEGSAQSLVATQVQSGLRVGWLRWWPGPAAQPVALEQNMPGDPAAFATRLYAVLHELDAANLDLIVAELPPSEEVWRAVRDRLSRASTGK